jgi:hypothetical protein
MELVRCPFTHLRTPGFRIWRLALVCWVALALGHDVARSAERAESPPERLSREELRRIALEAREGART